MFYKNELKNHMLGTLEIALFMPRGAERFSANASALKTSFLIPAILLPLTIITVLSAHPAAHLDMTSMQALAIIYILRLCVYLAGFLGLVYTMARTLDKHEDFARFATAHNWLCLPAALVMMPFTGLFFSGHYSWTEIYPLMVFVTLYSTAYTAFMATYVLRIPFELACFIAIASMALHETSLSALKWIAAGAIMMMS